MYENQIEIVDTICKPGPSNVVVLASRSGGKTYAVTMAAVRLCLTIPKYSVIVFGPKQEQATRIITELIKIAKSSNLTYDVDWKRSSRQRLYFKNS